MIQESKKKTKKKTKKVCRIKNMTGGNTKFAKPFNTIKRNNKPINILTPLQFKNLHSKEYPEKIKQMYQEHINNFTKQNSVNSRMSSFLPPNAREHLKTQPEIIKIFNLLHRDILVSPNFNELKNKYGNKWEGSEEKSRLEYLIKHLPNYQSTGTDDINKYYPLLAAKLRQTNDQKTLSPNNIAAAKDIIHTITRLRNKKS